MKSCKVFLLIFIVFVVFISSCKTIKNRNRGGKELTLEQIYDSVKITQLDYKSLQAKFSVKVNTEKKKYPTFKGNLKILKDSMIWVSLTPGLGIEVARIQFTKDSIFILDRTTKKCIKGKYSFIKKLWKVDVDYNSIESILTNRFFIYPTVKDEKTGFSKEFSLKNDSNQIIAYRKTSNSVENLLALNRNDFSISSYLINDVPNIRSLNVKYEKGNFENVKKFPDKVFVSSLNAGKNVVLDIKYTKVYLDKNLTFSFRIPDNYKIIKH